MASRNATRRPAPRQADYSNIGVAGRKTGVVLKDTGVRDEHGMEPIDGIFSSPDGPRSTRKSNVTRTSSSDMHTGTSSIPDPSEVLTAGRRSLPPAKARSPIKTYLNSPAKRSVGGTPLHAAVMRSPSSPHLQTNGRGGSLRNRKSNSITPQKGKGTRRSRSKQTFELPVSDEDEEPVGVSAQLADDEQLLDAQLNPEDDEVMQNADESLLPDESSGTATEAEEEVYDEDEEEEEVQVEEVTTVPKPAASKRGRPKKDGQMANPQAMSTAMPPPPIPPTGRKAQRGKGTLTVDSDRSRGKKRANAETAVETDEEPEPTVKRRKKAAEEQRATTSPPARSAKSKPGAKSKTTSNKEHNPGTTDRAKPRSRGLLLLRSETPADDVGATVLRSGRTSVKPMAYWRNEKLVYGEGRIEGTRLSLPGIKEVIRTEEVEPEPRPRKRRGRRIKASTRDLEEEDEDAEPWESEVGILSADVRRWDSEAGDGTEEDLEEVELAFAPKGLSLAAREVKDGTFLYGKTVTLPFFHSGVVDLPPGGEKRVRNARRHHMVFWVFAGRVDVELNEFAFSIGTGGMWQVPRGNWYGLRNPYDRPTRLFFAQACHMQEQESTAAEE